MSETDSLKYTDRTDRQYGIAGMTVGIVVYEGEKYIAGIDTSRADIDVIEFTPEFMMVKSPVVSAKSVWHVMAARYRLLVAMVMGNIVSRSQLAHLHTVTPGGLYEVIDKLGEQADDMLGLSADENRDLCLQTYNDLRRTFSHPAVHRLVAQLVDRIANGDAKLSRSEIVDMLTMLA